MEGSEFPVLLMLLTNQNVRLRPAISTKEAVALSWF